MPEGFRIVKGANGDALLIAPLAVTKAITERPILRAMTMSAERLEKSLMRLPGRRLRNFILTDAILDSRSIALIKHQNPTLSDEELARLVNKFQEPIALDTVRNEYLMHTKLYTWLMQDPARE